VPFLTSDTADVLGLLNFSLLLGIAVNLLYVVRDPRWLTALGDLVTTGVGLAVLVTGVAGLPVRLQRLHLRLGRA
jgi:hypothetical protein